VCHLTLNWRQVALDSLGAIVEPLPRSTLAAVLLHQQKQLIKNQPDLQREKILEGLNLLKPGVATGDQVSVPLLALLTHCPSSIA
jgi:hypothetical protein